MRRGAIASAREKFLQPESIAAVSVGGASKNSATLLTGSDRPLFMTQTFEHRR